MTVVNEVNAILTAPAENDRYVLGECGICGETKQIIDNVWLCDGCYKLMMIEYNEDSYYADVI